MSAAPASQLPAQVAAAALLAVALSGCGMTDGTAPGEGDGQAQTAPATTESGPERTTPEPVDPSPSSPAPTEPEEDAVTPLEPTRDPAPLPTGPVPTDLDQQPRVQAAISDLARRLEVPEADVVVAGWAEVTWPDGSHGCPQPGMMYSQALVPGEQLVLRAAGELFSYHAARGKDFRFCADPTAPVQDGQTS
ncbi:hypothetical protein [Ornithinicoccus halotolerans]|uniref:hypothetical protein n=1 Tax=Ornithinicoccus halotolerans TaxID=1748220 RepID=UPI0012956CC5|nr:hypothetical protein [Ornithinicoccus halotolerans]